MYDIRDGGSTVTGEILSSVVVSRLGVGGGEPLNSFSRGILNTVREGVGAVGTWEHQLIHSAHSLAPSAPMI